MHTKGLALPWNVYKEQGVSTKLSVADTLVNEIGFTRKLDGINTF